MTKSYLHILCKLNYFFHTSRGVEWIFFWVFNGLTLYKVVLTNSKHFIFYKLHIENQNWGSHRCCFFLTGLLNMNIAKKCTKIILFLKKLPFLGRKMHFTQKQKLFQKLWAIVKQIKKMRFSKYFILGGICGVPKLAKKPKITLFKNPNPP